MIPSGAQLINIGDGVEIEEQADQPSYTYLIDFDRGRIVGMADGLDAVKQAIFMILNTRRFAHVIFSWDYGTELNGLIGKDKTAVEGEYKQIITEALTADERITDVTGFKITFTGKRSAAIEFNVSTIYGDAAISEVITI